MSPLYRLVYHSRAVLPGPDSDISASIAQILATSQRNNARAGVTGALMFNRGAFAQVLEGPRAAIEATFERIQRDDRHGEVTVLQCAPVAERGFPTWSMAFVGRSAEGQALWGGLAGASGFDPARLDGDRVFSVLHAMVLDEEAEGAQPALPVAAEEPPLDPRAQLQHLAKTLGGTLQPPAPDKARYAEALAAARSSGQDGPDAGEPNALLSLELAIVKKALRAERQRVADLMARIESMQAALAARDERTEALRRDRDLWTERARLLALPVFQALAGSGQDEAAGEAGSGLKSVA